MGRVKGSAWRILRGCSWGGALGPTGRARWPRGMAGNGVEGESRRCVTLKVMHTLSYPWARACTQANKLTHSLPHMHTRNRASSYTSRVAQAHTLTFYGAELLIFSRGAGGDGCAIALTGRPPVERGEGSRKAEWARVYAPRLPSESKGPALREAGPREAPFGEPAG